MAFPNTTTFDWTAKIAGKDLRDFGFQLNEGLPTGLMLPNVRTNDYEMAGRHGVLDLGAKYDTRQIILQGQVWGSSRSDAWSKIDALRQWLALPQNIGVFPDVASGGVRALKLQLARMSDRYYLVNLDGGAELVSVLDAWDISQYFRVRIPLRAVYPFAVSDKQEWNIGAITATSKFFYQSGLGTVHSPVLMQILGAATNPKYAIGQTAYLAKFNANTTAVNLLKQEKTADTFSRAVRYYGGKLGQCIYIGDNTLNTQYDTLKFNTMADGSTPTGPVADRLNVNQGTIALWLRIESSWEDYKHREVFYAVASNGVDFIRINKTTGNMLYAYLYTYTGTDVLVTATYINDTRLPPGEWSLLTLRWSSTTLVSGSFYAVLELRNSNGTWSGGSTTAPSLTVAPAEAYLGTSGLAGNAAKAYFDEFAIWDTPLTDAQVASLYNAGAGARPDTIASSNLIAYLDFDGSLSYATMSVFGSNSPGYLYLPARNRHGVYVAPGTLLRYDSFGDFNPSQLGWVMRCIPQFPSDVGDGKERTLFDIYADANNRYLLRFISSGTPGTNGTLKFIAISNGTPTEYQSGQVSWSAGDYVEISGFISTVADSEGYYVRQYVNGSIADTDATAPTALATIPLNVGIGCLYADYGSHDGETEQFNAIIDECKLFIKAPNADELIKYYTDGDEMDFDNLVMQVNTALASGDILEIDAVNGTVRMLDASAGTVSNKKADATSGDYPYLDPTDTVLYLTDDTDSLDGCKLVYRKLFI